MVTRASKFELSSITTASLESYIAADACCQQHAAAARAAARVMIAAVGRARVLLRGTWEAVLSPQRRWRAAAIAATCCRLSSLCASSQQTAVYGMVALAVGT